MFISGLPGVANAYTCIAWVNALTETRRVILTAPTHVATRNMRCEGVEAITVQRLYNRYLKYGTFDKATILVIDEISQVNTSIWHSLMPLAKLGSKLYAWVIPKTNCSASRILGWTSRSLSMFMRGRC